MSIVTDISDVRNYLLQSPKGGLSFIEQLQISSLKPCTKLNTPYLTGVDYENKKALLVKTACKMWNCETCGYRNARLWIAKVINGVNKLGGDWYFFTITSSGTHRGASSVKAIRAGWKLLYNRIVSLIGKKQASSLYYCKVWEQHEDGTFHLHMLANFRVTKRWLKDNCFHCGLGYQAHIRTIDNAGQVAGYMAKYTLKNATVSRGGISFPKGLRRIETSHKWPVLPKRLQSELDWIFHRTRAEQESSADVLRWQGFQIVDKATK
jgi:hypothetical protein